MAEDKKRPKPPESVEQLLRRYAAGERDFRRAHLSQAHISGADLSGADLGDAILSSANLTRVNLTSVNLTGANLFRANLTSASLARASLCSADLTSASLTGANLFGAKLRDTNLFHASLTGADLRGADLTGAVLCGTDLSNANHAGAKLLRTDLSGADLSGADLTHADLASANLFRANLFRANLEGANLEGANLRRAHLRDANLAGAQLGDTHLSDLDLAPLCGADPPTKHRGPSDVDFRAILKSLHCPNLKDFLQKTGMPEVFIEYNIDCARSLSTDVFKMLQSTFISYGSPDEPLARKLYEALHRNGVATFFFAEHALPGEKLHRMMRKGVNEHDRVILVCSRSSLDRKGVLNEIEETLAREARDGGAAYLIPIRLDDYVFSGWAPANPDAAQAVRDRVVADFEGAGTDAAKFDAGMRRLIAALKK